MKSAGGGDCATRREPLRRPRPADRSGCVSGWASVACVPCPRFCDVAEMPLPFMLLLLAGRFYFSTGAITAITAWRMPGATPAATRPLGHLNARFLCGVMMGADRVPSVSKGFGTKQATASSRKQKQPKRTGGGKSQQKGGRSGSGLDALVRSQHMDNCRASAAIYGVCGETGPGSYAEGWSERLVPKNFVAPNNEPYLTESLLFESTGALLSEADCVRLIESAERHAEAEGWDQRYPIDGYTHEVNVADVAEAREFFSTRLHSTLLPAVAAQFPRFAASTLRVYNALVVKYDADSGHNCLPVHQDFGYVTLNVALSSSEDYRGGATWFQHSGETIAAKRGHGVLHAGRIPHCGVPVGTGTRYQLVIFLISTEYIDEAGRLQAVGAATGAKSSGALCDVPLSTATLQRSLDLNARDCETWSQLGHNFRRANDLAKAEHAFQQVVDISASRDFAALCHLARVQQERDDADAALRSLSAALDAQPPPGPTQARQRLAAQHNAAMALLSLGHAAEAGVAFESVIDEEPNAVDSWAGLGLCMAELDQHDAALACQRQVLMLKQQGTATKPIDI